MRQIQKIFLSLFFLILMFTDFAFSQTEYDYFEKQRLERKEKKVKVISIYDSYDRNYPGTKEYFNEDGNIVKIEYFAGRVANNDYKLYSEIIVSNIDTRGNLSGYDVIYYEGGSSKNNFENVTPSYFWDIGVMEETLVERVEYIFDKNGNVKKLLSYGDHAYPKEYTYEIFRYKNGKLNSRYDPDSKTETFFLYNENGLLDKAGRGNDSDSFNYYSYEFY